MVSLEIQILRDFLTKGEMEIKEEQELMDEKIEKEYLRFFARYEGKDVPESLRNEYRDSVKQIFTEKINKKKSALNSIVTRIAQLEQKYQINSALSG